MDKLFPLSVVSWLRCRKAERFDVRLAKTIVIVLSLKKKSMRPQAQDLNRAEYEGRYHANGGHEGAGASVKIGMDPSPFPEADTS